MPLKEVDDWLEEYRRLWEERLDRLEVYLSELQADQVKGQGTPSRRDADATRSSRATITFARLCGRQSAPSQIRINARGDTMQVQPYLFFDGRCEEAIEFYRKTLGAEGRDDDALQGSPEPRHQAMPPGTENKIMHASLRIGDTVVMASDGLAQGKPKFKGFSLSLDAKDEPRPSGCSPRSSDGGQVHMPLIEDLLLAALRHARRQVRRRLDDHGRAIRAGSKPNPSRGDDHEHPGANANANPNP